MRVLVFICLLYLNCNCWSERVLLIDLQRFVDKLVTIDSNGTDYSGFVMNYQTQAKNQVVPEENLFRRVPANFLAKPSVRAFVNLQKSTMKLTAPMSSRQTLGRLTEKKKLSDQKELNEKLANFFSLLLNTPVIRAVRLFLKDAGFEKAGSEKKFKDWMRNLWLAPVSNSKLGTNGSGFEHVFFGETSNDLTVKGMHNWLRYAVLELNNQVKYKGYYGRPGNAAVFLKYDWKEFTKPKGSFLLYTSPELDLALYTLCHVTRNGQKGCNFCYRGCDVNIITHAVMRQDMQITTAYPRREDCVFAKCRI